MAANQAPQDPLNLDDDDEDWTWIRDLEIIVVHNGIIPDDRADDFEIPAHTWTLDPKPLPFFVNFFLNIESTWYLAACLAILLAVHLELDTSYLQQAGYWSYTARMLSGVAVPVAFAVLSMVMYDVFGVGLAFLRKQTWVIIRRHIAARYQGRHQPWYFFPFEILEFAASSAEVLADFSAIVLIVLLKAGGLAIFEILTGYSKDTNTALADEYLAASWYTSVVKLAPEVYGGSIFNVIVCEVVPQFLLQICIASSLYWISILLLVKSQESLIFGGRRPEPFYSLLSALASATALHLMSGTAYQSFHLAFGLLSMTSLQPWLEWTLSFEFTRLFGFRRGFRSNVFPGVVVKALLLYVAHNIVAFACQAMTTAFWPLWRPCLAYLTVFVETHIQAAYPEWQQIMSRSIQRVHRRHYIRAAMTLLFGAISSWPMPANLFE
ncbi:hypothetical protein SLS62_004566 [Diatrype stigma]|uniref:Uncharacterized protein n=1 Tax=Diatrype stigma TaxID=117547 RepID=A0AAN9UT52_9PEZI